MERPTARGYCLSFVDFAREKVMADPGILSLEKAWLERKAAVDMELLLPGEWDRYGSVVVLR